MNCLFRKLYTLRNLLAFISDTKLDNFFGKDWVFSESVEN